MFSFVMHLQLLSRTHSCVCWPVRGDCIWTCHAWNHGCPSPVDQSNVTTLLPLSNSHFHMFSIFFLLLIHPLLFFLQLFEQLSIYLSLWQHTDWLKERISLMLGGAKVIHLESLGTVQPIARHYSNLSMFHRTLMSQRLYLHPRSLQGLAVFLDKYVMFISEGLKHNTQSTALELRCDFCVNRSDHSNPSLHEMGYFSIPINYDPSMLQVFLQSHADEAKHHIYRQNLWVKHTTLTPVPL